MREKVLASSIDELTPYPFEVLLVPPVEVYDPIAQGL